MLSTNVFFLFFCRYKDCVMNRFETKAIVAAIVFFDVQCSVFQQSKKISLWWKTFRRRSFCMIMQFPFISSIICSVSLFPYQNFLFLPSETPSGGRRNLIPEASLLPTTPFHYCTEGQVSQQYYTFLIPPPSSCSSQNILQYTRYHIFNLLQQRNTSQN